MSDASYFSSSGALSSYNWPYCHLQGAGERFLTMRIWCQFFPSWIPFEHSNFSLRLQPHSPIKPDWSDLRDLNFDCIQFSGFRTQWCNARSSLRCPCTIDWQFSRPARLIFPSGASRPIRNIRTHRVRVETIFGGPSVQALPHPSCVSLACASSRKSVGNDDDVSIVRARKYEMVRMT